MKKERRKYLKVIKYQKMMSDSEKNAFLQDLIVSSLCEERCESELMPYLLCDNFEGFQKCVKDIQNRGEKCVRTYSDFI